MNVNGKKLETLGVVATVAGIGLSLFSGWVKNKQLDELVSEKVSEEVTKQTLKNDFDVIE